MASIKLVIFDLDGTLLDTIEDLGDSVNQVLSSRGYPEHSYDQYCVFIGDGMEKLIKRSLPNECLNDPLLIEEVLNDYREAYTRNWNNKSRPYDGIMECLADLKARNIMSSVLSNKPHHFTELCVGELIGKEHFEFVLGQREGVNKKPSPDAAIEICEELNVAPEETIFIGDTNVDILTGVSAGMKTIGVLWGFREEKELIEAGAHYIATSPTQLMGIIENETV